VPSSTQNVNSVLRAASGTLTTSPLTQRIEIVGEVGIIVNQKIGGARSLNCTGTQEGQERARGQFHDCI
jgi:hypothetical protein